jgi:protein ImuB
MTKVQSELCPELALRARSGLQEAAAHAAMLDCAQSFSPYVEDAACDTMLLDLSGMESLFGSLSEISRAIQARTTTLGLEANVAVAFNANAAMLAARGFAGITVIPENNEAEQLGSLPVEVLFSDRLEGEQKEQANRLMETLHRWGIRTLHALGALPRIALSERLGVEGLRLQQLARGCAPRTLVPVEEPLTFEEAVELEHPITLLEPLAFLLNRLLDQLCARLASRALCTQELRLTLELENYSPFHPQSKIQFIRTLSLPLPMLDAKVFLKLLQLDLSANPPGAPIVKIHLATEPARPRSAQGGLFLPPSPEPEKLQLTLARIAAIVGADKVGAVELLDTHNPNGFRMRHFANGPTQKVEKKQPAEEHVVTGLRCFRPALRANVTLEDGQPHGVICAKRKEVQGNVLWKAGPWRLSGDWWERDAWSRDEWDIALQNGGTVSLYRLVHDLLGGGWFVEGTYD